ncbi:MAG: tetratricopeptide repeat protein, partial [Deltaproteobacteria bacterium]|nr:tetratricopeptide repeat protein [Deltaproteobacteria bacterium]
VSNKGVKAYQVGDYTNALNFFNQAASVYPRNDIAYYHLGLIYLYEKNDSAKAKEFFKKSLELNPSDTDYMFQYARILFSEGNLEDASGIYNKILKSHPGHSASIFWLGQIAEKKGAVKDAEDFYRRVIEADPGYGRAYASLASLYRQYDAWPESLTVLRECVRINPSEAQCQHDLGLMLLEEGKIDDAISSFSEGLKNAPENSTYLFNLANALSQKVDYRTASHYLKKFVVEAKGDPLEYIEHAKVLLLNLQKLIAKEETHIRE